MTSFDFLVSAIVWISLAMTGVLLLSAAGPTRGRHPIAITAKTSTQTRIGVIRPSAPRKASVMWPKRSVFYK